MECPECNNGMDHVDTTVSNYETKRATKGQHTGDIYECKECEIMMLDNFLTGEPERWIY